MNEMWYKKKKRKEYKKYGKDKKVRNEKIKDIQCHLRKRY